MADTDIGNRALILIGETADVPLTSLAVRPNDLAIVYTPELKSMLSMADWTFARKRTRLTAAGILDLSSTVVTISDADPGTIAIDTGNFVTSNFLTGDLVGISGVGNNLGCYGIVIAADQLLTLEKSAVLTDEVISNSSDLKLYAQPAYGWAYKYAQPSDAVRIVSVNQRSIEDQPDWGKEGKFVVSNQIDTNDQIAITYTQLVTDTDLMGDFFKECFAIKLASVLALVIKEDIDLQKKMEKHLDFKIKQAFSQDAYEGNFDEANTEHRADTGWQSAGR